MRLAGPERELVKNSSRGGWRELAMLQKFPLPKFWKLLEGVFGWVL
jgi:hypothetical protein